MLARTANQGQPAPNALPSLLRELALGSSRVDAMQLQTNRGDVFAYVEYPRAQRR